MRVSASGKVFSPGYGSETRRLTGSKGRSHRSNRRRRRPFSGANGWGQNHRRFADLASKLNRHIIPVVLPGCDQTRLAELASLSMNRRWVEYSSQDESAVLNELAQRIVDAAYDVVTPAGVPTAAETPAGRRLVVYVPARSQTVEDCSPCERASKASRRCKVVCGTAIDTQPAPGAARGWRITPSNWRPTSIQRSSKQRGANQGRSPTSHYGP